jgi:hypothetical protein
MERTQLLDLISELKLFGMKRPSTRSGDRRQATARPQRIVGGIGPQQDTYAIAIARSCRIGSSDGFTTLT